MPFFRLLGDTNGDGVVTGPYSTAGTDAYTVYHAEGETGTLLNADVNGDGASIPRTSRRPLPRSVDAVGTTAPSELPAVPATGRCQRQPVPVNATLVTQSEVQALMPAAIDAWQGAGLDAADVRKLENVPVQVGNLGTEHPRPRSRRRDHDRPDCRRLQLVRERGERRPARRSA